MMSFFSTETVSKSGPLNGKKIALLATDGFEQAELFEPKKALEDAGAEVDVISLKPGKIKGWQKGDWGKSIGVDKLVGTVNSNDYDGLMLPGGVINADKLRANSEAIELVKEFVDAGLPIAAICHAPWILIEAGAVKDRRMTSWSALKTDLENAGAKWSDSEVIVDSGLVTSRKPDDIPAFNAKMIGELSWPRPEERASTSQESAGRNCPSRFI